MVPIIQSTHRTDRNANDQNHDGHENGHQQHGVVVCTVQAINGQDTNDI